MVAALAPGLPGSAVTALLRALEAASTLTVRVEVDPLALVAGGACAAVPVTVLQVGPEQAQAHQSQRDHDCDGCGHFFLPSVIRRR